MAADLYQELGVEKSASEAEIKKAYRKLASKLHPDKNPGDKRSETKFKAVNRAYQTLSDPKKRALYDEFGDVALREGFDPNAARAYQRASEGGFGGGRASGGTGGGFRIEDIFGGGGGGGGGFGDLFGEMFSGRGGRAAGRAKGPDVASEITIDFAQAVRGTEVKLTLQDGGEPVTVRIPPGATDGDRVRLSGHGQPSPFGGPPGDLVLAIRVRPHPQFERRELDLYLDLPITIGEAYRGAKVKVPTPDGTVTLTVPKRAQSGQTLRLKGKGVHRGQNVGDLYVRFLVRVPDNDSKDIERAVDELERFMKGNIRAGIEL
jgi:curved DNA-binding protein